VCYIFFYYCYQVCEAVNTINDVAQGRAPPVAGPYDGPGELAAALDDFDEHIVIEPLAYNEVIYLCVFKGVE